MSKPFFLFVHVPKTGGTTFRDAIVRCLGHRCTFDYGMFDFVKYSKADVRVAINQHPEYDGLCSHHLTLDLPFDESPRPFEAISIFRDPVKRVLSWFFAVKAGGSLVPRFREMTINDFVREEMVGGDHGFLRDGQLRHLMGDTGDDALARFKNVVARQNVLVIPLEALETGTALLEHKFPDSFPDLRWVHSNASKKDSTLDEGTRLLLHEHLAKDFEAHQIVVEIFKRKIDQTENFHADSALKDFRRRCEARSVLEASRVTSVRRFLARGIRAVGNRVDL
ncbi:MAG: sulfotransferase family 2 domain-containing protein [Verrucomicrobia bacterium]|jgi:ribosomal protein S21|nr:sulfotransferase family 2 domain-containing protein [Verrucomicrobiota bacterium]